MSSILSHLADGVTQMLSQESYSVQLEANGVKRADGAQLPSNSPCEDRFNRVQVFPVWTGENWIAATIFDGHNGWQTAEHLEKELLNIVQNKLNKLESQSRTDEAVQNTIETCFTDLDDSIINNYIDCAKKKSLALEKKIRYMEVAMSGSCALLMLFNPNTKTLYTACTGDSRAVLGQQSLDGKWLPVALSEDQKGTNQAEMTRIQQEHPNEQSATENGKVLGLAVSRAFGNIPWKISFELQQELAKRFYTHGAMDQDKIPTPPYITAKPVVTITKLEDRASFVVLASDGIWDMCENWEVVDLVVRWLEAQPESSLKDMKMELKVTPDTVWWKREPQEEMNYTEGFDFLERFEKNVDVRFRDERTTIQDLDNVAVHILRNACGGSHQELLKGKLAFQAPYSRAVRDDMTIQVLFL